MSWSLSRSTRHSARFNHLRRFPTLERLEPRISMDGSGIVITDINNGSKDIGWDIQIQADGKLAAAGTSTTTVRKTSNAEAALVRYNADGTLDTSFSGDGKLLASTMDNARSLAIQNDGKIIAAGSVNSGGKAGQDIVLSRFNLNGSLDSSFDGDGSVVTNTGSNALDLANSVRLQADQRIVVAGRLGNRFGVARYNTNGSLDTSFAGTGKVTTDFGVGSVTFTAAESMAIQSDGKIVVGGWGGNADGNLGYMLIARYNTNGTLDATFGAGGKVAHFTTGGVTKLAVQSDGRIVAIGGANSAAGSTSVAVRFNSDGSLDTSFANAGVLERSDLYPVYGLALQTDGKIVLAGKNGVAGVDGIWTVSRLDASGNLDLTFGGTGTVQVFPTGRVTSVIAQPDGKLVLIGTDQETNFKDFGAMRLNSDGSLDTTFGGAAASTSNETLATADLTVAPPPPGDSSSISVLDATSVQQLLAEPESTWRKSRFRLTAI